jgi:hypothetical protein
MVVFNGIFNFILGAPDFCFWIESESSWSMFTTIDDSKPNAKWIGRYMSGFLSFVQDISYLTYIFTYLYICRQFHHILQIQFEIQGGRRILKFKTKTKR